MADGFDFGTLASAILPAAAGLFSGGGFTGAMYGAARGVGRLGEVGMQQQEFDLKKQEAEARQAMAEKRFGLQEKEFALRQERDAMLNKLSDEQLRNYQIEREQTTLKVQKAKESEAARQELLKDPNLSVEARRALQMGRYEDFQKIQDKESARKGLIAYINQLASKTGDKIKSPETMDIQDLRTIFEHQVANRYHREPYNYERGDDGKLHIFQGGREVSSFEGFGSRQKRQDAISNALTDWKKLNRDAGDEEWQAYLESPRGQLDIQHRMGEINDKEYQQKLGEIRRADMQLDKDAETETKKDWAKTRGKGWFGQKSDDEYKKWLRTPEGKQSLRQTREDIQAGKRTAERPTPGKQPEKKPTSGKVLDAAATADILKRAGGDPKKAAEIAKKEGYELPE